jgi:CRISPR-associated protein Csx10
MSERIKQFNDGLASSWVTVNLLSDAYLGLEEFRSVDKSDDDEYRGFLKSKIGLPEAFELRYVYKDQESVRGYDTSRETAIEMLRQPRLLVRAGAVFVYECPDGIDLSPLESLERKGIGDETQNGFGRVRICDDFHTKFDALAKEENT